MRKRIVIISVVIWFSVMPKAPTALEITNLNILEIDQEHVSLDLLFQTLKACQSLEEAKKIETRIWSLWLRHENPKIREFMNEGIYFMNTGNWRYAISRFDHVISKDKRFAEAWNKRATVYFLLKDYAQSLQDIRVTLQLEPRHFGAIAGMGLIYKRLGKLRRARRAFENLKQIYPLSQTAVTQIKDVDRLLNLRKV